MKEKDGMNQKKFSELDQIIHRDYDNIAGLVVQKNGKAAYEAYFSGYALENALHVFSVTKSVVNALIGIAVHQGCVKGIDQKVLDFFPDFKIAEGEKTLQKITIRHLLTMTAPYKYETEPYEKFLRAKIRFWMHSICWAGTSPSENSTIPPLEEPSFCPAFS